MATSMAASMLSVQNAYASGQDAPTNGNLKTPPPSPGRRGHTSAGPSRAHTVPSSFTNIGDLGLHGARPARSQSINSGTQTPDPDEGEFGQLPRHSSHQVPPYDSRQTDGDGPSSHSRAHIRTYADDERVQLFPRISKPVELLSGSYDYVVIGSGYGGAIAASRMARTGGSVCVLERGREKWPGQYPVSTQDSLKELHISGEISPNLLPNKTVNEGDPTGMFHLILGKGQNAVVCNGLGGTSLMNGNVFMEADKETLKMEQWPRQIREKANGLDKYYARVEKVLEPTVYPDDWPELLKMKLLRKQADMIGYGDKFRKVRQTTRFHNGPNSCGVEMSSSALTGQDTTGVNDGSKTTTLVTYLADAWNWGAEMFCECEVRYIQQVKEGEGYIIYFAWHGRNRGRFKANLHDDLMWVRANKAVFLGAGAIGTTEILLRSKAAGLKMSHMVGQNMSGNGDILAFGYNTNQPVNGVGCQFPSPHNPIGPTINGVIDCREGHENPLDGFVIEEGAVPHALAGLLQTMLEFMPGNLAPKGENVVQRAKASLACWGSRLLGPYCKSGAIEKTQVYLVMSHDSNQAVLSLVDDKPVLEFLGVGRSNHVKTLNGILARATQAVGGTLINNPFFALEKQEVTVHPIGGACMARDNTGRTGVTNHAGLLLKGRGKETYEGLIVTDAAVIPTALGANPFATIAALAERSVAKYVKKHGLKVDETENGLLDLFGEPKHKPAKAYERRPRSESVMTSSEMNGVVTFEAKKSNLFPDPESESMEQAVHEIHRAHDLDAAGFGFTEVMSGFIHKDENMVEDSMLTYQLAARTAKARCESARFFLSVQAFNTRNVVRKADHRAMLTGTFVCPTLPGSPFMVKRGQFNLFIADQKAPGTRNLTYDFDMCSTDNETLHFHGYKVVDSSVALSPFQFWRATSTLYVTITKPEEGMRNTSDCWRTGKVLAKGMMHIHPGDFLSEIMTLSPTGSSFLQKMASAASFLTFFTRKSLSLFLAPLTPLQYPRHAYVGYINDTPPDASFEICAGDGVLTRMHMWEPTPRPAKDGNERQTKQLPTKDVFMVPGAAVDHQIFATPTIPFNAVNYFCRAGYRVWISVHRIGQLMTASKDWTTYDARLDLRACLQYIRKTNGISKKDTSPTPREKKIYTIAHCMGSVAFASGLLDGKIPSDWIAGISASQVFMNPIWSSLNMAKALAGPVPLDSLYRRVAGDWFSIKTSTDDSRTQRALNQLLRLYPDRSRELCNNACCHRISLIFGRCWNHGNLNEATHRQIDRFFGGVNMTCLHLLMRMGCHGAVMRNGPLFDRLPTVENVRARLRNVPVFLWVGADNAVLSPRSTEASYEMLCDTLGATCNYKRRVVPGYGHLDGWMGRNAWRDVYPMILEEMDAVVRGSEYKFEEPDDRWKAMVEKGELL